MLVNSVFNLAKSHYSVSEDDAKLSDICPKEVSRRIIEVFEADECVTPRMVVGALCEFSGLKYRPTLRRREAIAMEALDILAARGLAAKVAKGQYVITKKIPTRWRGSDFRNRFCLAISAALGA